MGNKDPEGNIVKCTHINMSLPMEPYYTYNQIMNTYRLFPGPDIFMMYSKYVESIDYTAYYDIFDGYYNVTLKFKITVKRPKGITPVQLKYLTTVNNNNAPCFLFKVRTPLLFLPKLEYMADQPTDKLKTPVWDKEGNGIKLTENFG